MKRVIIHVDMDAFYASVEQHDHPEYRGKPVVVGAPPDRRGVIAAASYEARKYGIHSAMPSRIAYQKCPKAIFLPVHFKRYEEVSSQIREIFLSKTKWVQPISLDEAFLDLTEEVVDVEQGIHLAMRIKEEIYKKTKLTCSVGVGPNKFLAKIASDLKKPNGFVVVREDFKQVFLRPLPVRRIWGVGPVTEKFLKDKGFKTIGDLQNCSLQELTHRIGSLAQSLYYLAHGEDNSAVQANRVPKSMSRETTFEHDVKDPEVLFGVLEDLAVEVSEALKQEELKGKTIVLKLRYANFETHTRQKTGKQSTNSAEIVQEVGKQLLAALWDGERTVRLIGLGVSHFELPTEEQNLQLQMELFPSPF